MASDNPELFSQLREVFNLCDEERRGYLNLDQLRELGRKHLGGQEEDMVKLLEQLDPGGRGVITFPDFCKSVAQVMRMQDGSAPETNASIDGIVFANTPRLVIGDPSRGQQPLQRSELTMSDDDLSGNLASSHGSPDGSDSAIASGELLLDNARTSPYLSDTEERFECYGEGDQVDGTEFNGQPDFEQLGKPSLSSDSFRSTSSTGSLGSSGTHRRSHSNGGGQPWSNQRNTWLRSSLRRQSGSSKRLSSNALASQLFRSTPPSHSLNSSSRRSSISCDSDEMYTDQISLEDDVLDLNQKVSELQHQISTLSENQNNTDDRYCKVKQENAVLLSRIHNLEEQIRELEVRSEERMHEEERRFKEAVARQDRDKTQEIEHFTTRLYSLQQEHLSVKEELMQLRAQNERLRQEKESLGEQLAERLGELTTLQEDHRKLQELSRRQRDEHVQHSSSSAQMLNEVNREVEDLRRHCREMEAKGARSRSPSVLELPSRYHEMEAELRHLREENKGLREANEELQAQLLNTSLAEGRNLLLHPACNQASSLAEEFETLTKDQLRETLLEQQDVNTKLRAYIDGILLNIVENYPQLLEVKPEAK